MLSVDRTSEGCYFLTGLLSLADAKKICGQIQRTFAARCGLSFPLRVSDSGRRDLPETGRRGQRLRRGDSRPVQRPDGNLAREVLEKTGTAVVVATVETIGDNDPNDYANRLYQAWGIGKKGEDKGVLIFLAVKERRVRIETGYGVEGILPDGLTGEILDRYAIPRFREGDYGRGLAETMAAVSSVVAKAAGVTLTGVARRSSGRPEPKGGWESARSLLLLAAGFPPRHPPGQGNAPLASPADDERRGRPARRRRLRRLRRRRFRGFRRGFERRRRGEPRILRR